MKKNVQVDCVTYVVVETSSI